MAMDNKTKGIIAVVAIVVVAAIVGLILYFQDKPTEGETIVSTSTTHGGAGSTLLCAIAKIC